jgi:hypothetical protein
MVKETYIMGIDIRRTILLEPFSERKSTECARIQQSPRLLTMFSIPHTKLTTAVSSTNLVLIRAVVTESKCGGITFAESFTGLTGVATEKK